MVEGFLVNSAGAAVAENGAMEKSATIAKLINLIVSSCPDQ
jgi:hypothetical protein